MKNRSTTLLLLTALLVVLLPEIGSAQQSYSVDDLVTLGLESNPRLLAQTSQAEAGRAAWQASRRLFNPSLDLEFGSAESYDSLTKRNVSGISVSQLIENPVKRSHRISMAESEWMGADQTRRAIELEVVFEIREHAFLILLLEAREELARKSLSSLEEAYGLIATQVRLGETRELEGIRLDVEVRMARYQLNTIVTEKRYAAGHLNALLGNTLPEGFTVAGELTWEPLSIGNRAVEALQSHPLIGRSESDLAYARSQLGLARSLIIPDPAISGFRSEELDGRISGLGISFEFPLWNQNAKEVSRSRSIADMMNWELEKTRLDLSTEIALRQGHLALSTEQIGIFEEGLLNQAEVILRLSEISYRQGEISLLEFLDAQRTYYSILNDYQDSLYNWNLDRAALAKAVGEEIR